MPNNIRVNRIIIESKGFLLIFPKRYFYPYEKYHSTLKHACVLAEKLNVKNLLLYHTEDKTLKDRKWLYIEEGSKCYHGNIFVSNDLETIEL